MNEDTMNGKTRRVKGSGSSEGLFDQDRTEQPGSPTPAETLRIVELRASNFKRLRAVEVHPDGAVVEVKGRNAQGKTSLLDAIAAVFQGKRYCPSRPIRSGAERAEIIATLDNGLTVRRVWTGDDKSYLAVETADGAAFKSAQTVLDALIGDLSFDPLAFSRMTPAEQAQRLAQAAGVDFRSYAKQRDQITEDRRVIGREVKALEGRLPAENPSAPTARVDIAGLIAERKRLDEQQARNAGLQRAVDTARGRRDKQATVVADLEHDLRMAKQLLKSDDEALADASKAAEAIVTVSFDEVDAQLSSAESVNAAFDRQQERNRIVEDLATKRGEYDSKTNALADLARELQQSIDGAKLPVVGLGLSDDGVTLNGLPFDQASGAEQLETAIAIATAANPRLRVVLIRDGSLLDDERMEQLRDVAQRNNLQVWIERVARAGEKVGIVIEDGALAPESETV